ncbi:MAG: immune inhibitor A, partial [Clostridiales bacterium]|nr:immune inhibitor A [Clostridiales bacterium]
MSKKQVLLIAILAALLALLSFSMTYADDTKGLTSFPDPADPQSWILQRDMTWEDYHPNPVIDWMTEQNPAGLQRPSTVQNSTAKTPIFGGLILIDYLDRKFISRQPQNSDPTGFYMYKKDGTGMEDEITRNPVLSGAQVIADEKYDGDISKVTNAEFGQWWADYLNKPQAINNFSTIDEYYREASYGKWQVELRPYGPFTIPYFEFETMGYDQGSNFQTYRDVPPSFRRGSSGTTNCPTFDSIAIPFARDSGVPFRDLDFFFMLHAGYDESGVWQQLGMAQFANRAAVPYELGPGPRMTDVEKFFTENPSWLTTYATRYDVSTNQTAVRNFWRGERDRYAAMVTAGTADEYVFKLRQEDWDWVNGYNSQTQRNTRYVAFTCWAAAVGEWSHMSTASSSLTGAGRSIPYSTQGENDGMGTFAHEFGHIGGWPDNYQLQWTINNSPLTEPWEIMSRGQLGGPFDYHTRWQVPGIQGGTVPTNPTMRNKIVARYYDAATANPSNTIVANGAKHNDILEMRVQDLAAGAPLIAEVVARNIPLNNQGLYPQLDKYGLFGPNYYKGIHLTFATGSTSAYRDRAVRSQTGWTWTYTAQATWMGVEVVDMNGYDSFAPDHGVILTRHANESSGTGSGYTWNVIDSHLYDISMNDYMVPGQNGAEDDYVAHALGSPYQLWDAAFHVGKSFVDTGYYKSEYDPADSHYNEATARKLNTSTYDLEWKKNQLKPGSIQRWEPRNGREIASGDTVNEWHDPYNDLHFYILAKTSHDGRTLPGKTEPEQFLSYTIGVRHGSGTAVGGELIMAVADYEEADPGRVAAYWISITNTGEATDIIRAGVDCNWEYTLLNDLYAIGAGETIKVPVYVKVPTDNTTLAMTVNASSETNSGKKASVFCGPVLEIANVLAAPGGITNVTYSIKGNIFGFTTFDFDIPYDSSAYKPIALNPITKGALLGSSPDGVFAANPVYGGKDVIKASFASSSKVDGDGVLFTVSYEVDAAIKVLDLPMNAAVIKASLNLAGETFSDLKLQVKPGNLIIGIMGDIDGNGL